MTEISLQNRIPSTNAIKFCLGFVFGMVVLSSSLSWLYLQNFFDIYNLQISNPSQSCELITVIHSTFRTLTWYHCAHRKMFLVEENKRDGNQTDGRLSMLLRTVGPVMSTTISKRTSRTMHSFEYKTCRPGVHFYTLHIVLDIEHDHYATSCYNSSVPVAWYEQTIAENQLQPCTDYWALSNPVTTESDARFLMDIPGKLELTEKMSFFRERNPDFVTEKTWSGTISENITYLCLSGDSHTRLIYKSLTGDNCLNGSNYCHRNGIDFAFNHWPNITLEHDFSQCSHILINFGQWLISHQVTPDTAWTIDAYAHDVVEVLKKVSSYGKPVIWMQNHPLALYPGLNIDICPPKDFRYPNYVIDFNEAAKKAITNSFDDKIPIIDLFSLPFDVLDLTKDHAHYADEPIASQIMNFVMSYLDGVPK